MLKKLMAVVLTIGTVFAFSLNSLAYSRSITFSDSESLEVDHLYMPAGSYKGKVGISSITNTSSSVPFVNEVLYGPGFVVLDKTYSGVNSDTKNYSLGGLTDMHFSVERVGSANFTANVIWEYSC